MAGEGASGRNSGYLVDTTLNDGFTSNKELENYKKKTDIYELGIKTIKKFGLLDTSYSYFSTKNKSSSTSFLNDPIDCGVFSWHSAKNRLDCCKLGR